jgi:hypothetical protein
MPSSRSAAVSVAEVAVMLLQELQLQRQLVHPHALQLQRTQLQLQVQAFGALLSKDVTSSFGVVVIAFFLVTYEFNISLLIIK